VTPWAQVKMELCVISAHLICRISRNFIRLFYFILTQQLKRCSVTGTNDLSVILISVKENQLFSLYGEYFPQLCYTGLYMKKHASILWIIHSNPTEVSSEGIREVMQTLFKHCFLLNCSLPLFHPCVPPLCKKRNY
jgi:hypothetical protein